MSSRDDQARRSIQVDGERDRGRWQQVAVYVIGDVHGELDKLRGLIDRVNPGSDDILIQLGDCVDRGPDSYGVVEYWISFSRCQFCVIGGNHEELVFEYLSEGSDAIYQYGGAATIESYRRNGWECRRGDISSIPDSHLQFYLQTYRWTLPLLASRDFIFTHAGYDFLKDRKSQNPYDLRWGRVQGWKQGLPTVVRGHTPHDRVRFGKGIIEVDTGCGLGGKLSCVRLADRTVIQ